MSEQIAKRQGDGLLGLAARTTGTVVQVGLTAASMPLVLLPARSRTHARKAIAELALGAVALPRGVFDAVEKVVDDIWADADAPTTATNLNLGERARAFANRVATAAEDLNAGLTSIARRAGGAIERTAEDLDAWAQGRKPAGTAAPAKTVDDWVEKKA